MEDNTAFPVSIKAPFLSNLLVIDNIKLPAEIFEQSNPKKIHKQAMAALELLGLKELALKHYTALDELQYFLVQLVRTVMVEGSKIVIDRPFSMVSGQSDLSFITDALVRLNVEFDRVTILELMSAELYIGEDICNIKKWL